jgi:hypothetical protein
MQRAIVRLERPIDGAGLIAAMPLAILPAVACGLLPYLPDWKGMWLLAGSIYFGLKWLTFVSSRFALSTTPARAIGYLLLWPGMDAEAFLDPQAASLRPRFGEWLFAAINLLGGLVLWIAVVPKVRPGNAFAAGWIGMVGLSLVLHFGFAHFLSLGWRLFGVAASPIMRFPVKAPSLSDFWGRRWNMAFRDVACTQIFRPLVGRIGAAWATMAVFIVSGLIHDLVISVPVHGGWGGPTFYFLLQGAGVLFERSRLGRRLGLGRGLAGRVYCGVLLVGPLLLLFHEPFVRLAILPTLKAFRI